MTGMIGSKLDFRKFFLEILVCYSSFEKQWSEIRDQYKTRVPDGTDLNTDVFNVNLGVGYEALCQACLHHILTRENKASFGEVSTYLEESIQKVYPLFLRCAEEYYKLNKDSMSGDGVKKVMLLLYRSRDILRSEGYKDIDKLESFREILLEIPNEIDASIEQVEHEETQSVQKREYRKYFRHPAFKIAVIGLIVASLGLFGRMKGWF